MDILLSILWILAMISYSFTGDYARTFPNHGQKMIPFIRWGSLIMAMGLSLQLAVIFQYQIAASGMWIFMLIGFIVIIFSKLLFRWYFKKQQSK